MKSIFLFLFSLALFAQQPDCTLPINVPTGSTVPFNIGPFDNRTLGCTTWQITYNSVTYSALSIVVQTAPNAAGGVPGSWSTFTAVTGINPNTATTEAVSTFGGVTSYFPWLRVQLTTATGAGTISGRLYGWRIPAQSSGGTVTIPTPVPVDGPTASGSPPTTPPVLVAGWDATNLRTLKTDTAGDVQTQLIGNAAVLTGQQTVTASAVALATNTARNICIKALDGNAAKVYIGPTGITTATGMELSPGQAYCGPVTNSNLIFVRSAAAVGDGVSWIATN